MSEQKTGSAVSGQAVTAAMLAIGDELLSGRTRDRNIGYLANFLTLIGIDLKEVRIVADEETAIIEAVTALRLRYDYVFTSGGIGPTHDDITAQAIAAAFGVEIHHDPRVMALLTRHYKERGLEFTAARQRMARIPDGAELIDNPLSKAPGFRLGNVFTCAGVPAIFEAMLDAAAPMLRTGVKMLSRSVPSPLPEGTIGSDLAEMQTAHPQTAIGSYPRFDGQGFSVEIVIRSRLPSALDAAEADIRAMLARLETERT